MSDRNIIHTGKQGSPRLELEQSWWAMGLLGEDGREWSMEQKFHKIAEAGFQGISALIPAPAEQDKWHALLDRYGLSFSGIAFPSSAGSLQDALQAARAFGRVQYMNIQVMDAFVIDQEAEHLLDSLQRTAEEDGMPTFVETHRGTVTQDLIRTVNYVRQLPKLKLIIDLSHYVVGGELNGTSATAERHFETLLARTAGIHARVSNGEQIQIDVGPEGKHPMVPHFARWWRKGMACWLAGAVEGQVLPFVTELGPPGNYAITTIGPDGEQLEISDRWQQALLFKRVAEQEWRHVVEEAAGGADDEAGG